MTKERHRNIPSSVRQRLNVPKCQKVCRHTSHLFALTPPQTNQASREHPRLAFGLLLNAAYDGHLGSVITCQIPLLFLGHGQYVRDGFEIGFQGVADFLLE